MADDRPAVQSPPDETETSSDASLTEARDIGAASRSCLVILALSVAILLLVCVSWVARLIF